ncbi:hypothetical protein [Rickettsia sp.]|uniref:hypothetical protein n=1 Tax=Rickettsia sp. TaxID=789 RepID=UPI00397DC389
MQGCRYYFVVVSGRCCFVSDVIPAKAGIQSFFIFFWIPWSSHGMTLNVILTRNDEN